MSIKKKKHFEISERKILLRVFDVAFVVGILFLLNLFTDLSYFNKLHLNYSWIFVIFISLNFLATIFDMYVLQIVSFPYKITRGLLLTSFFTSLIFLLTPYFTPTFPKQRFQIIILFCAITFALFVWRLLYIFFLASTRFVKPIVLFCKNKDYINLKNELEKNDPHLKIVNYVSLDVVDQTRYNENQLLYSEIDAFFSKNYISEIVVANEYKNKNINVYNKLFQLVGINIPIREFEEVYEDVSYRIPLHLKKKSYYKFFPFTKQKNTFYILLVRLFDVVFSLIGFPRP